jgi:type II secretory pathway component PulK
MSDLLRQRSTLSDERGVALVLTLFIVALVSVLVLEFHFEAAVELDLAHNYGSDVQAYHVAMSGMRLAQELLAFDDSESDGPQDPWHRIGLIPACIPPQTFLALAVASAAGASLDGGLRGQEALESAAAEGPDRGCVSLRIAVEEERLPVNALMPVDIPDNTAEPLVEQAARLLEDWEVIFDTLFIQLAIDSTLLDALVGWLEDNGPMRTRRDLGMVPGFDAEIVKKLSPLITAFGRPRLDSGRLEYPKVNINTANSQVLRALVEGLSDGAGDMTGYVEDIMALRADNLAQDRQIESTGELQDYLPDEVREVFDQFATVQGTYFTVTSTARVEDIQKTVVAVLQPAGRGKEPIYFRIE